MDPQSALGVGWVDLAMAAFLVVSVLAGLVRGVVFELMSLAGWFVAWFAMLWLGPLLQPHLGVGPQGSGLNMLIANASVFIGTLVVWGLLARMVRSLVRATPLSVPDRILGAGFGTLRGLLVLLVTVWVVGVTPLSRAASWQHSQGVAWLSAAAREIGPFLPFQLNQPSRGESYVRHRRRDLEEPRQPVDL